MTLGTLLIVVQLVISAAFGIVAWVVALFDGDKTVLGCLLVLATFFMLSALTMAVLIKAPSLNQDPGFDD